MLQNPWGTVPLMTSVESRLRDNQTLWSGSGKYLQGEKTEVGIYFQTSVRTTHENFILQICQLLKCGNGVISNPNVNNINQFSMFLRDCFCTIVFDTPAPMTLLTVLKASVKCECSQNQIIILVACFTIRLSQSQTFMHFNTNCRI